LLIIYIYVCPPPRFPAVLVDFVLFVVVMLFLMCCHSCHYYVQVGFNVRMCFIVLCTIIGVVCLSCSFIVGICACV